jgi:hypothetical protein
MFYMLVPDPFGQVNGVRFTKGFVDSVTVGTLGHEFQHLINAGRRLYVNDAPTWEDTWLNEGLSHIAEELVFERAAGLTTRTRLDSTALLAPSVRSAFNFFLAKGNFLRLTSYLPVAETSSPYADNDDLETRGATWTFLRYAADRVNGNDVTLWQKLVASTKVAGMPNLTAALGISSTTLADWFRDWTVANYVDGYAAGPLDPRDTYRSWDLRSVIGALKSGGRPSYPVYPLVSHTLSDGVALTPSIRGGGAAYFRFSVGAGKLGRITTVGRGAPLPSNVVVSVVRTR